MVTEPITIAAASGVLMSAVYMPTITMVFLSKISQVAIFLQLVNRSGLSWVRIILVELQSLIKFACKL